MDQRGNMKKAKNLNKINRGLLWALTVALILSCIGSVALSVYNSGSTEISFDNFDADFQALMQQYATLDSDEITFELDSLTKINNTFMVESDVYEDVVGATVSTNDNEYTIQNDEITVRFYLNDNCFVVDDSVHVAERGAEKVNGNLLLPIEDISKTLGYELKYSEDNLVLTRPYAAKRLIVQAKGEVDSCGAIAKAEGYDGLHIFQYATEKATIEACQYLKAQSNVEWCEVDGVATAQEVDEVEAQGLTDSFSYKSWGATAIGADNYSQYLVDSIGTSKLKEVVVAVLDTGIDTDHPWFDNRIASGGKNYSTTAGSPYEYEDVKGHGTHVSGIICDVTLPNVKILPIKVLNDEGNGSTSNIVSAISYVKDLKAKGVNVCVINMSLSGTDSPVGSSNYNLYNNAIKNAYNAGILTVVSSGNHSGDVSTVSPANVETAITVGSVGKSGSSYFHVSTSNYGKYVDLCAPGNAVISAKVGGGTISMGGTSMAAPHVAASIALLLSDTNKNYSYTQIESVLDGNVIDLGDTGWDAEFGEGLINLEYIYATAISGVTFSNRVQSHTEPFDLRLTCSVTGAKIYYTQDGSEPTPTNGTLYTGSITIDRTQTITARAFVLNGNVITKLSDVSSMTYIFAGYDLDSMFTVTSAGAITAYRGTLTELVIPEVINGITVLSINGTVFKGSKMVSVTLPSTVTYISAYGFQNCTSLKRIVAPGVTKILAQAFEGCTSLQYVTDEYFPQLESIATRGFAGCSGLESISLSKLTTLGTSAFAMNGVEALRITTIDLPNVTSVGTYAFRNCQYLTDVNLPKVVTISSSAFENCGLTSINLPSATKIDSSAFKSCTSLTTVQLEEVETIGTSAFEGCISLNDLYLPLVTSISKKAFASCTSLTELTEENLPSVSAIGESAFSGCILLREVNLPFLDSIGVNAFSDCSELTTISMPQLTAIGNGAFSGCSSLAVTSIPQVFSIGDNAFENCVSLTQLFLPSITDIGSDTFNASAVQMVVIGWSLSQYTPSSIDQSITIYGYVSTGAHTYALEYGNNFVALDQFDIQQSLPFNVEVQPDEELTLSVKATGFNLKYAWYSIDDTGATLIDGQTDSSMQVDTSKFGTYRYYVVVINWDGSSMMSNTCTVVVKEVEDVYHTITASASDGGSISPNGNSSVLENGSITYTFEANEGFYISAIYVDSVALGAGELQDVIMYGYTFDNVVGNHTIWVEFTISTYTISITQGANGTISPGGEVKITHGGELTLTIHADAGYTIAKLIVDGNEVTSGELTSYTFKNVTDYHTFTAEFSATSVQYTVKHWQESLTAEGATKCGDKYYTLMSDTDTLQGLTDSLTNATARPYTGFSNLAIEQQIISGNGDTVVNVYYTRNVHELSLVKTDGIIQVDGANSYRYGEEITVRAYLQDGYDFTRWESSVQGIVTDFNNVEITITMPDYDATLTAYATIKTFTITVTQSEHGVISVDGSNSPSGNITVNYGASLTLKIIPNAGYGVAKLIVDGVQATTSNLNSYTFNTVTANHTFRAEFIALEGGYTVNHWQESLTQQGATEFNGKYFTLFDTQQLTGKVDSSTNAVAEQYVGFKNLSFTQQTILPEGKTVVNIYYTRNVHKLTLAKTDGISKVEGASSYRYGEEITVKAYVQESYKFTHWVSTAQGLANLNNAEIKITMPDSDVTLTAYAAKITFTITVTQSANGVISVNGEVGSSGNVTVNYGEDVKLTFTPNEGYHVESIVVNGATVEAAQTYTLTAVKQNYTVTATFAKDTSGPVVPSEDASYTVKHWQESLTQAGATEHDGKYYTLFDTQQLTGKVDSSTNATAEKYVGFTHLSFTQQTISSDGDTEVNIYYARNVHRLKLVITKGIEKVIGANSYRYGEIVNVEAIVKQGNYFSHWESTVQGVANLDSAEITVTMPDSDVTLTAYATTQTFTITVTQSTNGSISPVGEITVNYGKSITLTFTPNEGYHVESIVINGTTVKGAETYTITSVRQDYSITATFAKDAPDVQDKPEKPVVGWYWLLGGPVVIVAVVVVVLLLKKKK